MSRASRHLSVTAGLPSTGMLVVALLTGCEQPKVVQPPPPNVGVAKPLVQDVEEVVEATGTTEPFETVEVRARVQGTLLEIRHQEGMLVEAGQPMFRIDPAPFQATRDAASAQLAAAEAQAELADTTANRLEQAFNDRAVSELQALEARAQHKVTVQQVEVSREQLAIQELDLSYTEIAAPITGRTEKSDFYVGSLVGGFGAPPLTRIFDESKIRVWFTISDRVLLKLMERRVAEEGARALKEVGESLDFLPPVRLAREVDDGFPLVGKIDYLDPSVDVTTGTLRMRAVFDNADRRLLGGLFVRLQLPLAVQQDQVVVPESAIGSDPQGRFLLVVNDQNLVERRDVVLGTRVEAGVAIAKGLGKDDRVIVSGLLRARPNNPVTPVAVGPKETKRD